MIRDPEPGIGGPSGRRLVSGLAALALGLPASGAAQWVEPPGEGWVQVSFYHQDTGEQFGRGGDREPIDLGGESVASVLFLTAAAGLVPGVDGWIQVPFQRLKFTDRAAARERTGIGDARIFLRVDPLRYLGVEFPLALRGGVKFPVQDFQVDAEVIPLSDGQTDWELMLELGHSFFPRSLYASGWVGYRWRGRNDDLRRDFGDQLFFLAQLGGEVGPLGLKTILEGWDGDTPVIEGIPIASASREMLQVTPTISYRIGPGSAELGVRYPIAGRNLLSGWTLVAGYFTRWGL